MVTGTEVLTGRVRDRNGPWLSDRLLELGVELAHITICGDRPEDMEAQLRFMAEQGVDLVITSGGLGPTADDLTLETVARFAGRPLHLDEALEERIADILRPLMKRWRNLDFDAVRAANRKQALVPRGRDGDRAGRHRARAWWCPQPTETAPRWWSCPARRASCTPCGRRRSRPRRSGRRSAPPSDFEQSMLRLFGIPESEIAETLRAAEAEIDGFEDLEITTCLRRGEVEVVVRHEPAAEGAWTALEGLIARRHAATLFSTDGSTVDEQVAGLLDGLTVATAESCTGGLMAARLSERPGASAYLAGGVVAYANEAKVAPLGVDPDLIERHGAVSPEVAEAMADGRAGAILGATWRSPSPAIAGPGGGTEEKPVGTVCWCAKRARRRQARPRRADARRPGEIRDRSTTVGMHLLRRLLRGEDLPV